VLGNAEGIRAVVFDIYGTLFISGSGDISLAESEDRSPALMASLAGAGFKILDQAAPWSTAFMEALEAARSERMQDGVAYPEVRIEEVWQSFIASATAAGWLGGDGDVELAIVDHECRVNPCWPMPGLEQVLERIQQNGILLGIVSNAQFYTPLLFPSLTGKPLPQYGFNERCSVWSYMEREGKPSVDLYRKLKHALEACDINPTETLYVGNDMRNDIRPAGGLGFRTVLFAGDERSLRWREDDSACRNIRPEFIITELRQLETILGLSV
jgi:putative hydrolase of the HAD superfamily